MKTKISVNYHKDLEGNVTYSGQSFKTINDFEGILRDKVKSNLHDEVWNEKLINSAMEATGFSEDNFRKIFSSKEKESEWMIGEVLAEVFLESEIGANFYYNYSRDSKNFNTNQTGADIVGICSKSEKSCFLFGEVKTSSQDAAPPKVLYGKSGMISQIESLKSDNKKVHTLVKWHWNKATLLKGEYKEKCAEALKNYIKDNRYSLVGVLVRDTHPNERDLLSRAVSLSNEPVENVEIKLYAIYTKLKMEDGKWILAMNRGVN